MNNKHNFSQTRRTPFGGALFAIFMLFGISQTAFAQITLTATTGTPTGTFTTVNDAFIAINAGTHTGIIAISVNANTTEPAVATPLAASGQGATSYIRILIKPTVVASISGASTAGGNGVLEFDGADNITIDGAIGTGTSRDLTIQSTAGTAVFNIAAVRFIGRTTLGLGATNNTVRNCVLRGSTQGASGLTGAGTSNSAYGIYAGGITSSFAFSIGSDYDNFTIQNNLVLNARVGIYVACTATNQADNLLISGNTVGSLTNADADRISDKGMLILGANGGLIERNEVANIKSGGTTTNNVAGIELGADNVGVTISRNRVWGVWQSSTDQWTATGINLNGGNNHLVVNNLVYDIQTVNYDLLTTLYHAFGVRIGVGTGHKVYYNSVHLYGNYGTVGGVVGCYPAALIVASTTSTGLDIRNNIFANKIATGATSSVEITAVRFPLAYPFASSIINNNAYFVPAAAGYSVAKVSSTATTGLSTDVAAFRTATAQDGASAPATNQNAPFTADNILTIPASTSTELESAGVVISTPLPNPNIDFTGANRPVTPGMQPDMGAYEFNGIFVDLSPPSITYVAILNSCTPGVKTLTATITDASGVPTTGAGLPVAYWRAGSGAYTAVTGVSSGAGVYTFAIATGSVVNDVISYYVVARDVATTPNIGAFPSAGATGFTPNPPAASTPPTTPSTYTNFGTLTAGTYTVGTAGIYATLTAAVNAYNTSCVSGAVVFSLTDATYPAETFPITINTNITASATNTLTIRPATGATPLITGNATSIIRFNGASFVVINGSNNATTSRDLTIENVSPTGVVVWIGNTATIGSTNNVIRNSIVRGNTGITTVGSIIISSGITVGIASEVPNNNISIINNQLSRAQNGVFAIGNATTPETGWIFNNNSVGSTVVAEQLIRGIAVQNAQGSIINNNQIAGISSTFAGTCTGILIGSTVNGATISNNQITNVKNLSTTPAGAAGILVSSASPTSNINVFNNTISDVAGAGSITNWAATTNGHGIMVSFGGGINIYYNSVNLNTNQTNVGNSAAINIAAGITSMNIRNNILVNAQTAGNRYAIYTLAPLSSFVGINNNNYFTATGGSVGFLTAPRATLANWQTATSQDAASVSIDPTFTSATNLLPTNLALNDLGAAIVGFTTDITGATRSATTPDMGAFEFSAPVCPTLTVASPSTGTLAATATAGVLFTSPAFGATSTPAGTIYTFTTNAPAPFVINATTGVLSGIPAAANPGLAFTVTATPTIPTGCVGTTTNYTLVVNAGVPCPTSTVASPATGTLVATATIGTLFTSAPFGAVSTPAGTTYSFTTNAPAPFVINATTGVLSGTPTVANAGLAFTVTATPTFPTGCVATTTNYVLVINAPSNCTTANTPTLTLVPAAASAGTLVRGTAGVPYSQQFTGTGPAGTYTYAISFPTALLPAGLTFNTVTGLLSGTTNVSTSVSFRVTASVGGCASAPVTYTLVINPNLATSVDNALANQVKVSPNPSSGDFNVDFGSINMVKSSVRVYDAQGKTVFSTENNSNLMTIPLEKFANGIYLMEVETSKGRILKRLAKQ